MPLLFVSTAFMAAELMLDRLRFLAQVDPMNGAVGTRQEAMLGNETVGRQNSLLLLLFATIASYLATQAFRAYQRLG